MRLWLGCVRVVSKEPLSSNRSDAAWRKAAGRGILKLLREQFFTRQEVPPTTLISTINGGQNGSPDPSFDSTLREMGQQIWTLPETKSKAARTWEQTMVATNNAVWRTSGEPDRSARAAGCNLDGIATAALAWS
jgi:hypothetical protein